jgi:DNA-binding NarL/FixJ family response regulator
MDRDRNPLPIARDVDGQTPIDETVVLADSDVAFRTGVRRTLEAHGFTVVAEATTAGEAVAEALRHSPAICLLAVLIPGNGITAAEQISSALPDTKIVMLTVSERDDDLFGALRAGANGYLLKDTSAERLPLALRGVLSGEAALPRSLTLRLIHEYRNRGQHHRLSLPGATGEPVELTSREFEVLHRLQHGDGTATIAAELRISDVTVRRHISAVLHKIGVGDRRTALALLDRAEREEDRDGHHGR